MDVAYSRIVDQSPENAAGDDPPPLDGTALTDATEAQLRAVADLDPTTRTRALATLTAWLRDGVYDDLLAGFGDGVVPGLQYGATARFDGDPDRALFRRVGSAMLLTETIRRDNRASLLTDEVVLGWADRIVTWWLGESDLRSWVSSQNGYAGAIARGADAIGVLARSRHCGTQLQAALLEILRDRAMTPTDQRWVAEEPDRIAYAIVSVLHRGEVPPNRVRDILSPLLRAAAEPAPDQLTEWPSPTVGNLRWVLRTLQTQLSLGVSGSDDPDDEEFFGRPINGRPDLLLWLSDGIRATQPHLLRRRVRR